MARSRSLPAALVLIAVGIAILAVPAGYEGPVLLPISEGHAIAAIDAVGIVPLVCGTTLLYALIWQERARVLAISRARPMLALALSFGGGLGLGLLMASAFSAWYWWWAVGAALFGTALLVASVRIARAPLASADGETP
jgi:hypothetical protein